jgi:putative membrane protein
MESVHDGFIDWGWLLWIGIWFLFISSFGNWGYSYRTYRRCRNQTHQKNANDFLKERYAKGEIKRDEFLQIRKELSENISSSKKSDFQGIPQGQKT